MNIITIGVFFNILYAGLKLTGVLDVTWFQVFLPLILAVSIFVVALIALLLLEALGKINK